MQLTQGMGLGGSSVLTEAGVTPCVAQDTVGNQQHGHPANPTPSDVDVLAVIPPPTCGGRDATLVCIYI